MPFLTSERLVRLFERMGCPSMVSGAKLYGGGASRTLRRAASLAMGKGWLWLAVCLATMARAGGGAPAPSESDVKAVYLLRFAEYVDWPPEAFATPDSPITIGILGDRAVQRALEDAVHGEQVRNRRFMVKTVKRVEEARSCHIVFIGRSEVDAIDEWVARLQSVPVLTVSDWERFVDRGGMIRFVNEGGKVRLQINLDATRTARLTLSSRLLRVAADVVKKNKNQ